jgi:hypothetical protein
MPAVTHRRRGERDAAPDEQTVGLDPLDRPALVPTWVCEFCMAAVSAVWVRIAMRPWCSAQDVSPVAAVSLVGGRGDGAAPGCRPRSPR